MTSSAAAPDEGSFELELTHISGYEFRLKFDWRELAPLTLDEPAPLGRERGPNASRLIAAAVANCLSASLLFCLNKAHIEPAGLRTRVTTAYTRNAKGRLRIGRMQVAITLDGTLEPARRLGRCTELFEDYCVATQSVREGFPIEVEVRDARGEVLHRT
jgi:uncharacterized OsmC-like protein